MVESLQVEESEAQELFFENGWTDGLPVVPPTAERVAAFLEAAQTEAGEILGEVRERVITVSAEETAVNAVMAGCKPEYAPIVVAGVRALISPAYNANAALTSTGGTAICVLVSGPYAAKVGMNSGRNCLGQGNRANATIGRALRLVAMNIIGAKVGVMDGSSIGNPGKYSLCFAEAEPLEPWGPLRVELGFELEETTVTLLASEGPRQIANILNGEPDWVLRTMASSIRAGHTYIAGKGGQCVCLLGPEHAAAVRDAGWTRAQARAYLMERTRISVEDLEAAGLPVESTGAHTMVPGDDGLYDTFRDEADILLVTAGGGGAGWSACIPAWAPKNNSRAVTELVRV